jgi:hypothetical protein
MELVILDAAERFQQNNENDSHFLFDRVVWSNPFCPARMQIAEYLFRVNSGR